MVEDKLFFHIDLDAFYAAVEVLDNPQYRGKPIVVGGAGRRAVVSTCSYEARELGIHSAMPMYRARGLAPNAIFLNCRMTRYKEMSAFVMSVLKSFTPNFQQLSIDEAFLDMSGMERLFGKPALIAKNIKDEVLKKTSLVVSIGGGSNKYIAKMASSLSKPNGLLIVEKGLEEDFMKDVPLKKVWGVGKKSLERLKEANIESVGDILKFSEDALQHMFGKSFGSFLYSAVRGGASTIFQERGRAKSISSEHTFEFDETSLKKLDDLLFMQAEKVAKQLIAKNLIASSVSIKICYSNFEKQQHSKKVGEIATTKEIYKVAKYLFNQIYKSKPIRLLGLGVSELKKQSEEMQGSLFDCENSQKKKKGELAIRTLQKRYKNITLLRLLKNEDE